MRTPEEIERDNEANKVIIAMIAEAKSAAAKEAEIQAQAAEEDLIWARCPPLS
jgi:hypothetical protein